MTTSSTASTALTSILSNLTNASANAYGTSTSGPLITTGQINVTQLVSELMLVQSQPLMQVQSQEAKVKSTLSAYGQEQSALSSLQTAAAAIALPSAFQASSATVSGSGVSATVTGNPVNANYSVSVNGLAQNQSVYSASNPTIGGPGTLKIQMGTYTYGTNGAISGFTNGASNYSVSVTSSTPGSPPSLSDIAAAINNQTGGAVSASVVTDTSGSRLVMNSTNTGAANGFEVLPADTASATNLAPLVYGYNATTPVTNTMAAGQNAADASFSVNGLAMTSASNSVTTAINGVTLNLTQAPAAGGAPLQSQVQVATDPTAVTASVNSFISAYNAVISLTNTLTSYDASSNSASVLTGDSPTRNIVGQLQNIVGGQWSGAGTGPSWLAQIGVSTNRDGTLSLDATQFQAALSANPSGVASMFTTATGAGAQQGFANQMSNAVQQILGTNGALGSAEQNLQSQVTYMDSQQASMQAQLAQTQANLTQVYSALNAEVSAAQAQQASLTNQLAALPG